MHGTYPLPSCWATSPSVIRVIPSPPHTRHTPCKFPPCRPRPQALRPAVDTGPPDAGRRGAPAGAAPPPDGGARGRYAPPRRCVGGGPSPTGTPPLGEEPGAKPSAACFGGGGVTALCSRPSRPRRRRGGRVGAGSCGRAPWMSAGRAFIRASSKRHLSLGEAAAAVRLGWPTRVARPRHGGHPSPSAGVVVCTPRVAPSLGGELIRWRECGCVWRGRPTGRMLPVFLSPLSPPQLPALSPPPALHPAPPYHTLAPPPHPLHTPPAALPPRPRCVP